MHLFIKLWTPKPEWYALSESERMNFIEKAQKAMDLVRQNGLETFTWMKLEKSDPEFDTDHQFCSVYKTRNALAARSFHKSMEVFGWYNYFEQTNAIGEMDSPGAVLAEVLKL